MKISVMKWLAFSLAAALAVGLILFPATRAQALASCDDTYTIQVGDTLGDIAELCDISIEALLQANPQITNPNHIYAGQVLQIKAAEEIPTPEPVVYSSSEYVVRDGDTLGQIAERFGTTVRELVRLNIEIDNPRFIYVGQVLVLPAGANPPRIRLEKNKVAANTHVKVELAGFPASTAIDFRISKVGQPPAEVLDAETDENGELTDWLILPDKAKPGEKWVIKALTTQLSTPVEVTSEEITVIE